MIRKLEEGCGGVAATLSGCAVIQQGLDSLKCWTEAKNMKFKKSSGACIWGGLTTLLLSTTI